MMKRFKTLLFVMVMAVSVMMFAAGTPAMATDATNDAAQEEWTVQEGGADEEAAEENQDNQDESESEGQEDSSNTN